MTFALVLNVLMVVIGAAILGWLVRWHRVQTGEPLDPRDLARREAERRETLRRQSA